MDQLNRIFAVHVGKVSGAIIFAVSARRVNFVMNLHTIVAALK